MKKLILMMSIFFCTLSAQADDYHAWVMSPENTFLASIGLDRYSMLGFQKRPYLAKGVVQLTMSYPCKGCVEDGEKVHIESVMLSGNGVDIGGWDDTHVVGLSSGRVAFTGRISEALIADVLATPKLVVTMKYYNGNGDRFVFLTKDLEKLLVTLKTK